MIHHLILFCASFGFIFLKALQQRNVAHATYMWILPTSYAIGLVEVFVIATVAKEGWSWLLVFTLGTGAGLGATLATWLHVKYISKK